MKKPRYIRIFNHLEKGRKNMDTRKLMVVICIVTAAFCGCEMTPRAPAGRFRGERAPAFSVNEVLPRKILRGSNYRLAEHVAVQEYQYVFTVRSDFGEITARGRHMLGLRLQELKSIENAKKLSRYPLVVDGILTPLRDSEKGLDLIINEPFESIDRAPEGLNLMVDQYMDPADRRAGSPARRKLAIELDCDPETRNPVLKHLLDELTLYVAGGSLLTQGGMSFIPVPGIGALAMTAQMKELIVNSPPSVINSKIERELEAAGVESTIRFRFRYSGAFTTLQRLQLMEQFRALEGVRNRAALIEVAANAHTEAEALSSIRKGKMLADIRKRKQIRQLKFVGLFPLAVLKNGRHVLICPYDYVTSTWEVDNCVDAYRASNPNVSTVLVTPGRVSPAVLKKLESARIRVVEEGTF
ncbi:MAG: hypothetical protein JSW23_09565 [Planctomycetota bacterium]|nr:MAG: hypothetical protein JSW23_09565 [Planctomycetota bacterium]